MRWTRQRFARDGMAGRVERLVSDHQASGREMLQRTAKSCGPDAPMLASSSRSRVGPTGLRQDISADDGGKRARSPGRARRKPLKPLRAGTSGDSGVLVVARVLLPIQSAHGAAGAVATRRSPRPLRGESFINASGASRREGEVVCGFFVIASAAKQSILSLRGEMDCFAEPVIGRAFARPVGSQ